MIKQNTVLVRPLFKSTNTSSCILNLFFNNKSLIKHSCNFSAVPISFLSSLQRSRSLPRSRATVPQLSNNHTELVNFIQAIIITGTISVRRRNKRTITFKSQNISIILILFIPPQHFPVHSTFI